MTSDFVFGLMLCLSVAGLFYIYIGYPVAVIFFARWFPSQPKPGIRPETISVAMTAANEEHRIRRKLDSLFGANESERIIEVIIVSDGSTDGTVSVAKDYPDDRVRVIELPQRGGKPAALNAARTECSGEIVLLTDLRQTLDPACLIALLDRFVDQTVGVVSGELQFLHDSDDTTAAEGVGAYWRYEKRIRRAEGQFRSVPGATGACYAIRRELWDEIPSATILDDVLIPMRAVERGVRCVFEPGAIAFDRPNRDPAAESVRKRRTIAGVAQLLSLRPQLLLPWHNPIWWEFCSHKIARLLSPLLLILAFCGAIGWLLVTPRSPFAVAAFAVQIAGYLAAVAGAICQRFGRRSRLLGIPLMFVNLNVATSLALWDAIRGRYQVTWQRVDPETQSTHRTDRSAMTPGAV